jgi:hypothetical protein
LLAFVVVHVIAVTVVVLLVRFERQKEVYLPLQRSPMYKQLFLLGKDNLQVEGIEKSGVLDVLPKGSSGA